ncbi:hypothetical protein PL263_02930 [Methylomonas sp. EFPC3]|uniref:hypothetical protein n=1 Tax=Methylomonas TaxID=416 RepID=UPI001129F51C|nr:MULTISPECIES: hypothetical protein [Methylomonas]TPQ26502.1 hypothetical protein C2U68_11545 [Methylomonas koyamae]WFP50991.1 hypothetical protein PL263_02930 [Methylomonas sp. EFPC3]
MLIDSLSALFAFTSFIRWYEALLVAIGLGLLVFYLTPEPAEAWEEREPPSLYYYLQWSWLGYLRLKDAFYPFFVLYNAVLFLIDYRIQEGEFTVASWVTMHIIMALPLIYWIGAVWRCSDKTGARHWAVLARLLTVAAVLDLMLRWVIYQYYPNIFFNCLQMTNHWGDC